MNPNPRKKKKIKPVAAVRAAVQILSFILVPGLFISVFSAMKSIFTSVLDGSFRFSDQVGHLLLTAAVLLITVIWGRMFCGFVCSFGAMQDLLWLGGKRLVRRQIVPQKADRVLRYLKYAVLLWIVVGVWGFGLFSDVLWSPWEVFGMVVSPWKGFPTRAAFLSVGGALLLATVIGSLFIERFFCKYLCPLGAVFSLLARFRIFKIKRDAGKCIGSCRVCTRSCSMAIPLYQYDKVDSGECINCMKCTSACPRKNIKANPVPAVSGTAAALVLSGVCYVGNIPTSVSSTAETGAATAPPSVSVTSETGKYKDGVYTGTADGYRGKIAVQVTVSGGHISDITVLSATDDGEFFSQAQQKVIPAILSAQDTNVSTVSGATYSSRGIINAVAAALGTQLPEAETPVTDTTTALSETTVPATTQTTTEQPTTAQPETTELTTQPTTQPATGAPATTEAPIQNSGRYSDGVYTGSGSGLRGTTSVSVTVSGGDITDITVTSYQDDGPYFSRASSGVIPAILSTQSVNVSTVSGATFSSNSILEAVADALGLDFTNPNSSMSGGHGHGR